MTVESLEPQAPRENVPAPAPDPLASMIVAPISQDSHDEDIKFPRGQKDWERWKSTGSKQDLSVAMKQMSPAIDEVARANPGLSPSLLRSKAKVRVYEAFQTYDPAAGASLSTHVRNHLKPMTIRSHNEARAMPKGRFIEEATRDYHFKFKELSEMNLEAPGTDEMADAMKISRERSSELMRRMRSFEVPEGGMDGAAIPEDQTIENRRLKMWTEYVYQDMSPRDKKMLDMRMGRNGYEQMGMDDIARENNTSVATVHKVLSRASTTILDGVKATEAATLKAEASMEGGPELSDDPNDLLPAVTAPK